MNKLDFGGHRSLNLVETIGRERLLQLQVACMYILNIRLGKRAGAARSSLKVLQRRFETPEQT
ncbi:MAG: hypothetical protein JNL55_22010 [Steroidobacter sp.]|nr:hypothetical protein [Steroidobacter sp.]